MEDRSEDYDKPNQMKNKATYIKKYVNCKMIVSLKAQSAGRTSSATNRTYVPSIPPNNPNGELIQLIENSLVVLFNL